MYLLDGTRLCKRWEEWYLRTSPLGTVHPSTNSIKDRSHKKLQFKRRQFEHQVLHGKKCCLSPPSSTNLQPSLYQGTVEMEGYNVLDIQTTMMFEYIVIGDGKEGKEKSF